MHTYMLLIVSKCLSNEINYKCFLNIILNIMHFFKDSPVFFFFFFEETRISNILLDALCDNASHVFVHSSCLSTVHKITKSDMLQSHCSSLWRSPSIFCLNITGHYQGERNILLCIPTVMIFRPALDYSLFKPLTRLWDSLSICALLENIK